MMKRAGILKLKGNRFIIHPINTLSGGGGVASEPFIIGERLSNEEIAEKVLKSLENSMIDAPRPLDWKAWQKHYLKSIGVKSLKELHDGSLSIGVFTKDGKYHISPTVNKGARDGFQGATVDRIVIPLDSSVEELAEALKEAFEKSS